MENDTDGSNAGEDLSVDQVTALYVKSTAPKEADTGQSDDAGETNEGDTDDELQASEDAGEDGEGETEGTDQAEEGEDEPDSEQGRFVADNAKVRLPDGTVTTIAELKQGSLRQADYTRKTQEVAEGRKAFETQSSAIKQRESQLAEREAYAATLIQSILPQAPDVAQLQTDPVGYMQAKANFDAWQQHQSTLTEFQQRTQQERQAETQQQAKAKAEAEWTALVDKVPELKDQQKAQAFGQKLLAQGRAYGFTEEEIRSLLPNDHRMALALRDAIKWRELQASKPKVQQKVENRPPVQKGGKRLNPSESKARQASEAFTRLQKSGSEADAAAAWLATRKTG